MEWARERFWNIDCGRDLRGYCSFLRGFLWFLNTFRVTSEYGIQLEFIGVKNEHD